MTAWGRGCVKTLKKRRRDECIGLDILESCGLPMWMREKKGHSSPHCRHERGDSEDLHRTFHVVGKNVQAHLGTDAWDRLGEEVRRSHPGFDRAKWMLGGLAAYSRCLRSAIQSPLHFVEDILMLPT